MEVLDFIFKGRKAEDFYFSVFFNHIFGV